MKPPKINPSLKALLGATSCLGVVTAPGHAAEVADEFAGNWYRTELLIFVREDATSRSVEDWNPLPELHYPENTRFLINPAIADRRLAESLAYTSSIDEQGVQTLIVPGPVEELLDHSRPDAIVTAPQEPELAELLGETDPDALPGSPIPPGDADELNAVTGEALADAEETVQETAEAPIDPDSPVLALPYQLLDEDSLSFRSQARSLRRQGHRIVFHGSWWAQLEEEAQTPALILDHSGDMDSLDWPALQGSVQIYLSRYLHINVDLWLNTMGDYLPEGWQIDAPPLAAPSLASRTPRGESLNPWAPAPEPASEPGPLFGTLQDDPGLVPLITDESSADSDEVDPTRTLEYPWHHAIVHRQSRRMRSKEIHYLDHPVIGVVLRIVPVEEDTLPLLPAQEREFRERHGLPVELFVPEAAPESP
jgi:hypothetical protein